MRTFSEIVDALMDSNIIANASVSTATFYVQSAITELNLDNLTSAWDTVEFNIRLGDLASGNRYPIPADYLAGLEVNYDRIPDPVPRRVLGQTAPIGNRYWYQAGNYLVFSGQINHSIQLAYSRATPVFKYYPQAIRLFRSSANPDMIFDYRPAPEAEWQPYNPNNPQHTAAYYRHANWVIERWATVILTGAKSLLQNDSGNLNEGGRLYSSFNKSLNRLRNNGG